VGGGRRCRIEHRVGLWSECEYTPLSVMLKQAANLAQEGQYEQALAIYQLWLDSPEVSDIELRAYVLSRIADVNIQRACTPKP
jgi:hypothetical protein